MEKTTLLAVKNTAIIDKEKNEMLLELIDKVEQLQKQKGNALDLQFYWKEPKLSEKDEPFVLTAVLNINGKDYKEETTISRFCRRQTAALKIATLMRKVYWKMLVDFLDTNPQISMFLEHDVLANFN